MYQPAQKGGCKRREKRHKRRTHDIDDSHGNRRRGSKFFNVQLHIFTAFYLLLIFLPRRPYLLIFIVKVKCGVQPAPAQETFDKRNPTHDGNQQISPSGVKLWSQRPEPPEGERKP